jgi:hypothetical protein
MTLIKPIGFKLCFYGRDLSVFVLKRVLNYGD